MLHRPSWNTGQGVLCCGEAKKFYLCSRRETDMIATFCEGQGLNRAWNHSIETRSRSIYSWAGWSRSYERWRFVELILKHRKSFSTLFPTSKRQIETRRFHFIRLTKVPTWQHVLWSTSLWGNRCSHMLLVGTQNDAAIMKKILARFSKVVCP